MNNKARKQKSNIVSFQSVREEKVVMGGMPVTGKVKEVKVDSGFKKDYQAAYMKMMTEIANGDIKLD